MNTERNKKIITPEAFLVQKGLIRSEDLETKFNLSLTRDCHIHTTKQIVEALKEYAEIAVKNYQDEH